MLGTFDIYFSKRVKEIKELLSDRSSLREYSVDEARAVRQSLRGALDFAYISGIVSEEEKRNYAQRISDLTYTCDWYDV